MNNIVLACFFDSQCTWFPGLTQFLNPNGISMGSVIFAGLARVTDRQTNPHTTLLGRWQ